MTPAEVVDLVFPDLDPEYGEHSLRCGCRATDATCKIDMTSFNQESVAAGYCYGGMYGVD